MPIINFQNALRNNNIELNDVNINSSIEFAALTGSFIGGTGDFVNLFEPNALKLEKEGYGYVVASVGKLSGVVPYTAYNARTSYIENNKELLKSFTKALNRGIEYVLNHSEKETAKVIYEQFADLSLNDIETIVKRYKDYDSWYSNSYISEEAFNNLQTMMVDENLITDYTPYEDLIYNLNE